MKMSNTIIGSIIIGVLALLSGCAYSSLQPETYSRDAAQEMRDVFYGEVVKVKAVNIEGDINWVVIIANK